jgi:hypothetical protein
MMTRKSLGVAVLVASGAIGCGGVTTLEPGDATHHITVSLGQSVDIVLQTIGPGEYASPPRISPALLVFVGVSEDGPPNPGGPRQRFQFRATAPGDAVITFTQTFNNSVVHDTVSVR